MKNIDWTSVSGWVLVSIGLALIILAIIAQNS
jgi:hypothetical protein